MPRGGSRVATGTTRYYREAARHPPSAARAVRNQTLPHSETARLSTDHDPRLAQVHAWLRTLPASLELAPETLQPASSDASFRRYFRLNAGARTLVVMDAPPPHEDVGPFLHVGSLLSQAGLNVPQVLAQDPARGLLLLDRKSTRLNSSH